MALSPVTLYRASAFLYRHRLRRVARVFKGLNFVLFHAVIPPELIAGRNLDLPHYGLGVVIHPRTIIGDDVVIYHGVTLATDIALDDPRAMRLGDRVFIGAGATLLGPIHVGDDGVIGAGSVVTGDVPAGCVMAGVPARIISRKDG
jgi:serine O-acetyltransferase